MKKKMISVLSLILLWLAKKDIQNAMLMDGTGRFIQPFHPECKDVNLEVIAIALSRIMRFFGQTKLSVAQHSVNMAKVFIFLEDKENAKQALLHEVAEAFMGDLASPLKKAFPIYKQIEESLIKKVFGCYGLSYPMSKEVHELDKDIMINEATIHMPNQEYWYGLGSGAEEMLLNKAGVDFEPWSSEKAQHEFVTVARELELLS